MLPTGQVLDEAECSVFVVHLAQMVIFGWRRRRVQGQDVRVGECVPVSVDPNLVLLQELFYIHVGNSISHDLGDLSDDIDRDVVLHDVLDVRLMEDDKDIGKHGQEAARDLH